MIRLNAGDGAQSSIVTMGFLETHSVREQAMGWITAFWEGNVFTPVARAHTTPEPDDLPPPKNDPIPQEVPQPDPVPVQDPMPHQEPIKRVN
jgi:hypothetical protein